MYSQACERLESGLPVKSAQLSEIDELLKGLPESLKPASRHGLCCASGPGEDVNQVSHLLIVTRLVT